LAHAERVTREDASTDVRLASALDRSCEATRRALALGVVNPAQALVITKAITDLPATVGDTGRAKAGPGCWSKPPFTAQPSCTTWLSGSSR